MDQPAAPTMMGMDIYLIATLLSRLATLAVIVAIYAATTVRDPMAKRVKALNERREQLKAGITASTRKRSRLNQTNRTTEQMRSLLASLRVLQDKQLKEAQTKLMQAGIRSKDAAIAVIFARMVLPIVIGGTVVLGVYVLDWFPTWGGFKQYMLVAGTLLLSYKAPDLYVNNKITKRTGAIRKGLPDALDLLVICAEA